MKKKKKRKTKRKLTMTEMAQAALKEAVQDVINENIQAGLPLVVWKDGKVVRIPPQKLKKTIW